MERESNKVDYDENLHGVLIAGSILQKVCSGTQKWDKNISFNNILHLYKRGIICPLY
jgi:hypothetical protein